MRRLVLIAAVLLIPASAQAAGSRSLSLASNDEPIAAEQPKAAGPLNAQLPKAEVPKVVEQQSDVTPQALKADLPKPDQARLGRTKSAAARRVRSDKTCAIGPIPEKACDKRSVGSVKPFTAELCGDF